MENKTTAIYARIALDPDSTMEGVSRQVTDGIERVQQDESLTLVQEPGSPAPDGGHWPDGVFVDNNLSATADRPEYERMMQLVADDQVKVIVCRDQARLWRNRRQMAEGLELLKEHKVRIEFTNGPGSIDFATASGRMIAEIQGGMDKFYREVSREIASEAAKRGWAKRKGEQQQQ